MNADDIARILDELQQRLDGPARYLFDITIRQVLIEALIPWVCLVPALIIFVLTYRRVHDWDDPTTAGVFALILGIAVGLSLVTGVSTLPHLLNPEYAALERLLSLVVPK